MPSIDQLQLALLDRIRSVMPRPTKISIEVEESSAATKRRFRNL